MLFNTISFAIFLIVTFFLYWCCPSKYRWAILLGVSYYFYMGWNVKYVLLIFMTTIVSYLCAILIEKAEKTSQKRAYMILASIIVLGILFVFKYFNFLLENIALALSKFSISWNPYTLKLLLPVGISFYTFQTLSYVIDVYERKIPAEKHFGYYAAFISFFPQLVAGPIERTSDLLPQIKQQHMFSYNKASYGLKLMAVGYFKKIVLADTFAIYVDKIYADVHSYRGFTLLAVSLFFTFQIYCDFSGYSDIAIGTAKLMDIDLTRNFASPYFSVSIHDFWKRWHISLSSFFRDYVYIPLGGNRCGKIRNMSNVLITFLLSGLWHGASWNYIFWGGWHGVGQALENLLPVNQKSEKRGLQWWARVCIMFVFIDITWIFFRNNIGDSLYVIVNMFQGISSPIYYLNQGIAGIGIDNYSLGTLLALILLLIIYDFLSLRRDVLLWISKQNLFLRWTIYVAFVVLICVFSQKGETVEFVYFQF